MKRCAVFSCMGLGDGLIALVLSNNLRLNGYAVTTFHPFLSSLQEWFPRLPISPFPPVEKLASFDAFYLIYEKSPWMQAILEYCQTHYPSQTKVLNPIATPNRDYPYWEVGRFDGRRPFVENLYNFCKEVLQFPIVTKSNGITPPEGVEPRSHPRRVILHPVSSREGKNWPREKYLELATYLSSKGYEPLFALTPEERQGWEGAPLTDCTTHSQMAQLIAESGYMIGNDSGIGHLASCLGLPTLTICRSAQAARFWRPAWSPGHVVTPSSLIPNLKGLRLRDTHWKKWVSTAKVMNSFDTLTAESR